MKRIRITSLPTSTTAVSTRFVFILALIILLTGLIRIRWLPIPFERDEGEYAYIGQLLLQGVLPFEGAYTMKLPGTSVVYALIMLLFGQTVVAIHFGLLLVNAGTIIAVASLARKLKDWQAGLYAAAIYAVISLSSSVFGFAAHSTHFVVFFALSGILLIAEGIDPIDRKKIFLGGICLGLSILMKQPGVFFAAFSMLWMLFVFIRSRQFSEMWKSAGVMISGILIPLAGLMVLLYFRGTLDRFWLFTVQYAQEYATYLTLEDGAHNFFFRMNKILREFPFLWGLMLVSLGGIFLGSKLKQIGFLFGFLLFSFFAVCPGLFFRHHYFILLFPAIAVTAGIGISNVQEQIRNRLQARHASYLIPLLLITALLQGVIGERWYFFDSSPENISRAMYGRNPFNEALRIGEYLESHTQPDERIMILGSEPEIYFYARRRSASGYIYMYNLTEPHPFALQMQKEMIGEVEQSKPRHILLVGTSLSWQEFFASECKVYPWVKEYCNRHYRIIGVADFISRDRTDWSGFGVSPLNRPQSENFMYLLERYR